MRKRSTSSRSFLYLFPFMCHQWTFLRHHVHYVFLMFFTLILAISLVFFLLLHLYQVCFNITSNENAKRQAIRYVLFPLPVYISRIIMQTSLWVCSLLWWHNPLGWIFVLFAWNSSCTPVNMYVEQIWFPSVLVILIRFFRTGSKSSSPTIL